MEVYFLLVERSELGGTPPESQLTCLHVRGKYLRLKLECMLTSTLHGMFV